MSRCLIAIVALLVSAAVTAESALHGEWVLNTELTQAEQPDGPKQRQGLGGSLPQAQVSVGGVPLPTPGSSTPVPAAGSPRDPRVLHSATLIIEPQGDALRLIYGSGQSETLQRGNDQGLVSRWSDRKLTTRYETTSRKVSQVYQVRRDGHLLVTVKLNPNRGPSVVHKRVFERAIEM